MRDLLPPNSTEMERILADMFADGLDVPVQVGDLWNADKCPLHLLPWLAHQYSVDVWRDDWSEAVKRQVIKNSIATHSIKGTKQAIINALLTLGIVADVVPWFEMQTEGDPYSFEVTAWLNDQIVESEYLINPNLRDQIGKMVDAHKSARDEYVFKVGTLHNDPFCIRSVINDMSFAEFSGATYVPEYENSPQFNNLFSGMTFAEFEGASV